MTEYNSTIFLFVIQLGDNAADKTHFHTVGQFAQPVTSASSEKSHPAKNNSPIYKKSAWGQAGQSHTLVKVM